MGYIDEHDERMFWSLLASKLAHRDLTAEEALSASGALDEEQRSIRLFEIIERYEDAFAQSGIESVRVAKKTAGIH